MTHGLDRQIAYRGVTIENAGFNIEIKSFAPFIIGIREICDVNAHLQSSSGNAV